MIQGHDVVHPEAAITINTLRLCQALNCSPQELDDLDAQFVADVTTILRYEAEMAKSK